MLLEYKSRKIIIDMFVFLIVQMSYERQYNTIGREKRELNIRPNIMKAFILTT